MMSRALVGAVLALGVLSFPAPPLVAPARAQDLQPTPPVSSELPTRLEEEHARDQQREPLPLAVEEQVVRPSFPGESHNIAVVQGRIAGVDAKSGELRVHDESGVKTLRQDAHTIIELDGRPTSGLVGLVPGQDVRASYTPDGVLREVQVQGEQGAPQSEGGKVRLDEMPHTNANAPNPSAPEPTTDPPPGGPPGGLPAP
jgi:hypothetical protein